MEPDELEDLINKQRAVYQRFRETPAFGDGPEDLCFPIEWLHGRIRLEDGRAIGVTSWEPSTAVGDIPRVTIQGVLFPADKREPEHGN